jgi:uncharacterized protein YyaL (SSP411 family)
MDCLFFAPPFGFYDIQVAKDILNYVQRDLSDPNGGFYSAEDADSLPMFESMEKRGTFFFQ